MKKSIAPLVLMMIFSLVLALGAVAQKKTTATAWVDETVVFDYADDKYLSSKKGEVDNHYTNAKIIEQGNWFKFELNVGHDSVHVSEYLVIERKRNGKVIIAKKITDDGTDQQIKIVQRRHTLDVHCAYRKEANRYDAAILFTNLIFI